jgi:hypothetical protein
VLQGLCKDLRDLTTQPVTSLLASLHCLSQIELSDGKGDEMTELDQKDISNLLPALQHAFGQVGMLVTCAQGCLLATLCTALCDASMRAALLGRLQECCCWNLRPGSIAPQR